MTARQLGLDVCLRIHRGLPATVGYLTEFDFSKRYGQKAAVMGLLQKCSGMLPVGHSEQSNVDHLRGFTTRTRGSKSFRWRQEWLIIRRAPVPRCLSTATSYRLLRWCNGRTHDVRQKPDKTEAKKDKGPRRDFVCNQDPVNNADQMPPVSPGLG
jgi:hypothetical protein